MKLTKPVKLCVTLLIAMLLPNCSTNSSFDLNKAVAAIDVTIPPAVRIVISKQPAAKPYLEAAVTGIDQFALGAKFDPDALNKAITAATNGQVSSPEVLAAIDTAVGLYKLYYDDVVQQKLDQNKNLKPLLQALADAIRKALLSPALHARLSPEVQDLVQRAAAAGVYSYAEMDERTRRVIGPPLGGHDLTTYFYDVNQSAIGVCR